MRNAATLRCVGTARGRITASFWARRQATSQSFFGALKFAHRKRGLIVERWGEWDSIDLPGAVWAAERLKRLNHEKEHMQ